MKRSIRYEIKPVFFPSKKWACEILIPYMAEGFDFDFESRDVINFLGKTGVFWNEPLICKLKTPKNNLNLCVHK